MGDNERKDQKMDIKSEPTNMYNISKEKNEALRKEISEMTTRENIDRFSMYAYIIELLGHAVAGGTALHDLWTIPVSVEKFHISTFTKTFNVMVEINNKLLDLGELIREERKEALLDMPMQKISQKVVDAHLDQMFG